VAPAADAQPSAIDVIQLRDLIDRAEQVYDFLVAPVREDRLLVSAPAPVAAAVIHLDDDVAGARERLPLEIEGVAGLAVRAAVYAEERRIFLAGTERRRLGDQAMHLGPVLARRRELFSRPKQERRHPLIVLMRQPTQAPAFERGDLRGLCVCRAE